MSETILSLSGIGVPPYSARGLRQTLEPIQQSIQLRRTINGNLADLSASQMRKYISTISGNDQQPPAVSGVWPGKVVNVDCIPEICVEAPENTETETEPEITTEEIFERTPVPGSVRHESGFVFFRPRLTMRVATFTVDKDEWGAAVSWQMVLEEV